MKPMGLLLVMMEPPAECDAEFQAWYDTEHMPQRRTMPGFRSAARWVCVTGWPRWLALYDLESLRALETPEYLAVAGERSTPWTRRILGMAKGYRRVAAEQVEPGDEVAAEGIGNLIVTKVNARKDADRIRSAEGLVQFRVFECTAEGADAGVWVIAGFSGDAKIQPAGEDVWNEYVPYAKKPAGEKVVTH
jgi:hypothetical protein